MKRLEDILSRLPGEFTILGSADAAIHDLHLDSRKVKEGDAFIAIKGSAADGHQYIDQAINKGVTVVFCQHQPVLLSTKVTYVIQKEIHKNLWELAAGFYGNPTRKLQLIGVTGTNGKTTVATMFYSLMQRMNVSCGLISTVNIRINEELRDSELTTPDVVSLNRLLDEMVQASCQYVIMEVSSHAIHQNRIQGLEFAGGVFTNITHDHLDYHKTFKEYLNTKKLFFDMLSKEAFAITNADDRNGMVMVQNTHAKVLRYAIRSIAEYKAKILEFDISGMHLQLGLMDFYTRLVGKFNVYNLLAVIGIADNLGFERIEVLTKLSDITSVEGRFDLIRKEGVQTVGIVDYAHTPDALENVLKTINEVNVAKVKLITVVGCGGDRDKTKRPIMADIATRYSDVVVLTSDNPRSEDIEEILDEMEAGVNSLYVKKLLRISDRKMAIKTAVTLSSPGDIILVAGKGHEKYQDIKGVKYPFDDKKILQEFL